MDRDFAADLLALERELAAGPRWRAAYGLRDLEEAWARHLLGLGDGSIEAEVRERVKAPLDPALADEAAGHLAAAERWQWELGTLSTGSGEGLASMASVYRLELAQAWLAAALARQTGAADHARRAEALATTIERDPNGLGAVHAAALAALRAWLSP